MKKLDYDQMQALNGSQSTASWACNMGMGASGLLWATAFGAVSMGAGFVVGFGWLALQTYVCSHVE